MFAVQTSPGLPCFDVTNNSATLVPYRGRVTRTPKHAPVLFYAALVSFVTGLVAIIVVFAIHVFSDSAPNLALYAVAMFASPLGFLLAIIYALTSGRRSR